MRRALTLMAGFVAVLLMASNSRSQSPPKTPSQPDIQKQLREENQKLREQLNRTHRIAPPATQPFHLRILPYRQGAIAAPPTTQPSPIVPYMPNTIEPFTPDPNHLPEGWIKKEFNGEPFYLIPCKDSLQRS